MSRTCFVRVVYRQMLWSGAAANCTRTGTLTLLSTSNHWWLSTGTYLTMLTNNNERSVRDMDSSHTNPSVTFLKKIFQRQNWSPADAESFEIYLTDRARGKTKYHNFFEQTHLDTPIALIDWLCARIRTDTSLYADSIDWLIVRAHSSGHIFIR